MVPAVRYARPAAVAMSSSLRRGTWPERRLPAHGEDGGGDLVGLVVRQRPAVEQKASFADDADDGRLVDAQRRGERLLDGAGEARHLGERERAATDAADGLLDVAADPTGKPL